MNRKKLLIAGFITLALPISASAAGTDSSTRKNAESTATHKPGDATIATGVANELFFDRYFSPDDVAIDVHDGVVILRGIVDNLRSRDRALQIAEHVRGVRSVVDELKVNSPLRSDADIVKDLKTALRIDAATDNLKITPTAAKGIVTLAGQVDSWTEKSMAEFVAKGVKGVRDIRDDLTVKMPPARPTTEIAEDIRARLRSNPWIDNPVSVNVQGDKAILSGTVGSIEEKRQAFEAAWISGINNVDISGVKVDPNLPAPPLKSAKSPAPNEIQKALDAAFTWDPRVNSFRIQTTVQDGVATLNGTVDNLKAARAAENDAKNTRGVFSVVNNLKITGPNERTDKQIADDVKALLVVDPLVDKYQITVGVKNGTVTLSGTVDTLFEKYYAEDDASRITGVRNVDDKLKVRLPTQAPVAKSDSAISTNLKTALSSDPVLDKTDKVSFTVKNGKATLTGTVDSWVEATSAVDDAFAAGAREVVTNLKRPGGDTRGISYTMRPVTVYHEYWVSGLPWLTDSAPDSTSSGTTTSP